MPNKTLKIRFNGLVLPLFNCVVVVWGTASQISSVLFKTLNLIPLYDIINLHIVNYAFKKNRFSDDMKRAEISPIFRKNGDMLMDN